MNPTPRSTSITRSVLGLAIAAGLSFGAQAGSISPDL
jgi:hypothetical protein